MGLLPIWILKLTNRALKGWSQNTLHTMTGLSVTLWNLLNHCLQSFLSFLCMKTFDEVWYMFWIHCCSHAKIVMPNYWVFLWWKYPWPTRFLDTKPNLHEVGSAWSAQPLTWLSSCSVPMWRHTVHLPQALIAPTDNMDHMDYYACINHGLQCQNMQYLLMGFFGFLPVWRCGDARGWCYSISWGVFLEVFLWRQRRWWWPAVETLVQ